VPGVAAVRQGRQGAWRGGRADPAEKRGRPTGCVRPVAPSRRRRRAMNGRLVKSGVAAPGRIVYQGGGLHP